MIFAKRANLHRSKRAERDMYAWGVPSVYGRLYRRDGRPRATIVVSGPDESGCHIDIRANASSLRDCEVIILAALDRRGLREWADRLMGGAK